jgi:hypothetical protein
MTSIRKNSTRKNRTRGGFNKYKKSQKYVHKKGGKCGKKHSKRSTTRRRKSGGGLMSVLSAAIPPIALIGAANYVRNNKKK